MIANNSVVFMMFKAVIYITGILFVICGMTYVDEYKEERCEEDLIRGVLQIFLGIFEILVGSRVISNLFELLV